MSEEERIEYLNNRIIILNRRIKNISTRDDIIGLVFGFLIFTGINAWYILDLSEYCADQLYPTIMVGSIGLGMIPGVNLPTYKTIKKVSSYQMEIREYMNELHQFALEENERMAKVKKLSGNGGRKNVC